MERQARQELKLQVWSNVAREVSKLSTCKFTQVGCVLLTEDFKVISTGYNGTVAGAKHCCDITHADRTAHGHFADMKEIHAEMNAILQVSDRSSLKNSICFSTLQPCYNCIKHMVQAGVTDIYFSEEYWRINKDEYISNITNSYVEVNIFKLLINEDLDKNRINVLAEKWL